jgi:hypothetical protein
MIEFSFFLQSWPELSNHMDKSTCGHQGIAVNCPCWPLGQPLSGPDLTKTLSERRKAS